MKDEQLIIEGNSVYEIDEECLKAKKKKEILEYIKSEERSLRNETREERNKI